MVCRGGSAGAARRTLSLQTGEPLDVLEKLRRGRCAPRMLRPADVAHSGDPRNTPHRRRSRQRVIRVIRCRTRRQDGPALSDAAAGRPGAVGRGGRTARRCRAWRQDGPAQPARRQAGPALAGRRQPPGAPLRCPSSTWLGGCSCSCLAVGQYPVLAAAKYWSPLRMP